MNLFQLWCTGILHPGDAFYELKSKPAPAWGFWVVLVFNLLISATTLLTLYLLGRPPLMPSVLTFLPTEKYLLTEMFFLPPLRVIVWLIASSTIHLGLRLVGQRSDFDQILNIGGLGYLVTMPFILVSDWSFIAANIYPIVEYTHPLSALWGLVLTVIGLKKIFGTGTGLSIGLAFASMLVSIPLLALLAR